MSRLNAGGCFTTFTDPNITDDLDMPMVVIFDAKIPKDSWYRQGAFHVILATPSERSGFSKNIPELTALSYIYFNGVRGDGNEGVTTLKSNNVTRNDNQKQGGKGRQVLSNVKKAHSDKVKQPEVNKKSRCNRGR